MYTSWRCCLNVNHDDTTYMQSVWCKMLILCCVSCCCEQCDVCGAERQVFREKLGEVLSEKMLYIIEAMSRHEYVPKIPNQTELDLVFDVSLPDVQPYLFKVIYWKFIGENAEQ